MEGKTCFFIGHWEPSDSLLPEMSAEVERHITEYGATDFVVDGYRRFDALSASCVEKAKQLPPEVMPTEDHSDYLIVYAWHPASNMWYWGIQPEARNAGPHEDSNFTKARVKFGN